MIKRSKQRFEVFAIVRYILRFLMLCSRLPTSFKLGPITFALFGLIENVIGMIRMFNIKKRIIKLAKFSNDRQKQLLQIQKS